MTDEQIEAERQEFERVMGDLPYEFEMDRLQQPYRNGEYRHYHTKCAWDAWIEAKRDAGLNAMSQGGKE